MLLQGSKCDVAENVNVESSMMRLSTLVLRVV